MSDKETWLKVAHKSFVEGKKNNAIAKELKPDLVITENTNLSWVQDLIDEAGQWLLREQKRLVELEEKQTLSHTLATELIDRFGLLGARVVDAPPVRNPADYSRMLKRYGEAGAAYFDEVSSDAENNNEQIHVAVSGGQTILEMSNSLMDRRRNNVHYYSAALIGRGDLNTNSLVSPETNATIAWSRSGRIRQHLYCGSIPPYDFAPEHLRDETKEHLHELSSDRIFEQRLKIAGSGPIKRTLQNMNREINMAIAGLGTVEVPGNEGKNLSHVDRVTIMGLLKPLGINPDFLYQQGARGDISYNLFNEDGRGSEDWQFFITAGYGSPFSGVEFYRNLVKMGKKVIVMAGARKEAVIKAALDAEDGKLLNVLITDVHTAKKLLEA